MDLARSADGRTVASTRERILDIALELFAEQGYRAASLRDIAERLGTTKAALYYHFERKEDILRELDDRLSAVGATVFEQFTALPDDEARVQAWPRLVDEFIGEIAANRTLMLFQQRNNSELRALRGGGPDRPGQANVDQQLLALVSNPAVPLVDRVRISCSVGAIMTGLIGNEAFGDDDPGEVVEEVRGVIRTMFPAPSDPHGETASNR